MGNNFTKQKSIGKKAEVLVHNYMVIAGIECDFNTGQNKSDYDLLCKLGNKKFTIECKLDFLAGKTQNIALEIGNPQKGTKTGIESTLATLWAVLIKDDINWTCWLAKVSDIKSYMLKHKGITKVGVGDGNSTIVLYKCDDILKIFKRIDNVSVDKISGIIKNLIKG